MTKRKSVWESKNVADAFLEGERGAVPGTELQLGIINKIIIEWFPHPERILDIGCGNGILGKYLLGNFPNANGIFTDLSDTMLEAASENLKDHPESKVIKADFSTPGWLGKLKEEQPFDIIISGFSIHHLADQRKKELYSEIYKLLSPGGIFINMDHVESATPDVESLFEQYYIDHLHNYQFKTDSEITRDEVAENFINRPDKEEDKPALVDDQCSWLKEIGFKDVDCFFKLFVIAIFGGRKT